MSTSPATSRTTSTNHGWRPRVWLVAGGRTPDPHPWDLPVVRDTLMRTWRPGADGLMHTTTTGRHLVDHHTSWPELRARYDLVEVA